MSTCYVAGNRRGNAPEQLVSEGPFDLGLNWRREVAAARRLRSDTEATSRLPDQLRRFPQRGAQGARRRGCTGTRSQDRDRCASDWVTDQLVEAGRARAGSVGWPDAYAYTKALGEQALTEMKGNVPVNIVRPSIIESALAEPFPGWIRGFRMAEPVIISYARGLLKQFPGVPEGTIDVIPVDIVVAAIIAVAAIGPTTHRESPRSPAAASTRCATRRWSTTFGPGSPSTRSTTPRANRSSFPSGSSRHAVGSRSSCSERRSMAEKTERVLQALPLRGKQATWAAKLDETQERHRPRLRVRAAVRVVHRMRSDLPGRPPDGTSHDALDDVDQAAFNIDPRTIDWPTYISTIHLPSIVHHSRAKTTPGKNRNDRTDRLRRSVLSPDRHLAAFDLENTLISSNVVESYSWLATRRLNMPERVRYVLRTLAEAPSLSSIGPQGPRRLPAVLLPPLRGRARRARSTRTRRSCSTKLILTKSFPAGIRRVREHRALGHRTILITGALDFAVAGLRRCSTRSSPRR